MDEEITLPLSEEFFKLLMQIHKKIIKPDEFMKGLSIPPSHGKVIFYLAQKGPSSVSNIAKALCISKPNMTPIIDKLLEEGFVTRSEDPNDRRILRIEITQKAMDIFKMKRHFAISSLQTTLSTLEEKDQNTLKEILPKFNEIISKLE